MITSGLFKVRVCWKDEDVIKHFDLLFFGDGIEEIIKKVKKKYKKDVEIMSVEFCIQGN